MITPETGSLIVGNFLPERSTAVHDDLHVRSLVIDDGRQRIALAVCDLLGLHRSVSLEARRLIEAATGIPPSHVLISATHTHSAASALGDDRFSSDQELDSYQRLVAGRIAEAVERPAGRLRPAEATRGFVDAPGHVFNRRWFMRGEVKPPGPFGVEERVKMNPPPGSPDLLEPAGPVDPRISFLAFREPSGRLISVFAAYSLHYVGGTRPGEISADYYGMFCEALVRRQGESGEGPPFVPILANGTSGDVNNINFRQPRAPAPPYAQMRAVAEDVAAKVHGALEQAEWRRDATVDARFRELELSWRRVEKPLLEWAERTLPDLRTPIVKVDLPAIYAGRVQRLAAARDPARIPLQAIRIGDCVIGTFPCETFAETGLAFRERCRAPASFMVELNHGYFGYLPTPRHFGFGGYETWPGTNCLEPEASDKMLDALLSMAAELVP